MELSIRLRPGCTRASGCDLFAPTSRNDDHETRPILRWQVVTVALMLVGYSGYYLCRSDFSVALPLTADELAARGVEISDNL